VESHYHWKGRLERSREVLIIFKTHQRTLPELERVIVKLHPYDTPEIVAIEPGAATARYLEWWRDSMR
jgi:periplasmic divalent cation tolerance protein